ncbi:hydroxyacyl-CoA dehydrogenase domain-containing protein [Gonapodya prolifera JEL478]|uniref:Hydroxyacyl-CoA dehydrogenase domain-containing protein n=1 Tax=Gonapodya prolifera (strain JEL478) TaxID=1344416 RepID=A0A138ZYN0_GONPJ|nr:hydroxyacyl-CoA dehydrogenase domain-containing protein [Gonapodya prolifera JEL478]|eukprot:KXS09568.1 hydroxyacyl-CoA dehydrogenase domain-containing protein [Gonapodya prolifera JEL478]
MALRFDGRVVIVTGAGGGLGKQYALYFASRGAKVVVNDLGGSMSGAGASSRAADVVVEEITKAGGSAVANYDSVENGDKIVDTAMKAYGRVDIVINNAGILRDISFQRMQDADWDLVQKVHVYGTYKVTKAAWKVMQDQKFGRIINTASVAGIQGNFGQVNYSAAKLAAHGFTLTLAREGAKYNIQACTVAPMAASRMTETIMKDEEDLRLLDPAKVVPFVGWLAHESCKETGTLFEAGGGWIAKLRRERSQGVLVNPTANFTPAAVSSLIGKINDFTNPEYPVGMLDYADKHKLEDALLKPTLPKPAQELRFDGRVAIVTGAGNGVGRAHAHMLAQLGAKVVVNDLGGSVAGVGSSSAAAQKVVDEIAAFGGVAVANYDNVVTAAEKVVETAIKAFGRVDILINNAGILRDKSFARMSDEDWNSVQAVHLRGIFAMTKAVWPHFKKQKYGRIVCTSSSVGQANYSSGYSGIVSFSNSIAIEGQKDNILSNTICPSAGTRMIATIPGRDMTAANQRKPEYISPLVAYLCHESSKETRGIFEVGGGWIAKVRWQRTGGVYFPPGKLTAENIRDAMPTITNFDDGRATHPTHGGETFLAIQTAAKESKAKL